MIRLFSLTIIACAAFLPAPVLFAGPGDGGGGGSTVRCSPSSPWVLLDRANQDPPRLLRESTLRTGRKTEASVRLERFDLKNSEARQRASEILGRWKGNSPELVEMIELAMDRVPYFRTNSSFVLSEQFSLSPELKKLCPQLEIRTAILYLEKFGSIISEPLWQKLDTDTQAGLLIHEALRQVQFAYGYRTENSDLEAVVGQIMDGDPAKPPGPQNSPHIKGQLRRYFEYWKSYRKRHGADAPARPEQACSMPSSASSNDLIGLLDACAYVLAISSHLNLNKLIDSHQKSRTENELNVLWQQLADRNLLQK